MISWNSHIKSPSNLHYVLALLSEDSLTIAESNALKAALINLHRIMQIFLYSRCDSSWEAWLASGRFVQGKNHQRSPFSWHLQSFGVGSFGDAKNKLCQQIITLMSESFYAAKERLWLYVHTAIWPLLAQVIHMIPLNIYLGPESLTVPKYEPSF